MGKQPKISLDHIVLKIFYFSRNPPPSFMEGAMGGSAVDRIGADPDALLSIPDD